MVDFYGLPQSGASAWPGRHASATSGYAAKASTVENALLEDVTQHMGESFNRERFVPYVMMHEYEAMLFSDCRAFGRGIGTPALFPASSRPSGMPFEARKRSTTRPKRPQRRSKRLVPAYSKLLWGHLAAFGNRS